MTTGNDTVATTTSGGFRGADVEGLDRLAQEFEQAAQVCDEVRMACELIVAVAPLFGPFGAAFISYLAHTVIPWLKKISEALTMMAKILSSHSHAQKDVSSSKTSLPSYRTPANLPQTHAGNYPVLPSTGGTNDPTSNASGAPPTGTGAATVSAAPTIGGPADGTTTGSAATTAQSPLAQDINAVANLVTAIARLTGHDPACGTTGDPGGTTGDPGGATGDPGGSSNPAGVNLGGTALGGTALGGALPAGTDPGLGSPSGTGAGDGTGGIAAAVHPGDTVGLLSVPVAISPDGHITPLLHASDAPATSSAGTTPTLTGTTPSIGDTHPAISAGDSQALHPAPPAHPLAHLPQSGGGHGGGSSGGYGGGSGGGYGGGSGGG